MRNLKHILMLTALLIVGLLPAIAQAQNVKTYIHPRATALIPVIKQELEDHFDIIPMPWYIPGLIEHESCISLKHSKCWSTTAKLHTKWKDGKNREYGAGLGQLTKAWRSTGELRFDTLANLKKMFPNELHQLTWENMTDHPELQVRAIILLVKSDYRSLQSIPSEVERLKMTDSAYNGGVRDVHRARKICGLTKGCNPNIWFNHVEKHSVKSDKVLYGNRSPKEINIHHVRDVFETRMPKYKPLLASLD